MRVITCYVYVYHLSDKNVSLQCTHLPSLTVQYIFIYIFKVLSVSPIIGQIEVDTSRKQHSFPYTGERITGITICSTPN